MLLKRIAEELLQRKDIHAEYMPQNYEDLLDLSQTPVTFLGVPDAGIMDICYPEDCEASQKNFYVNSS